MEDKKLLLAAMGSEQGFVIAFKVFLESKNMSVIDFARKSGIPQNTLYKIVSGERLDFRISTLRQIFKTVRDMEGVSQPFVALITGRAVLDRLKNRTFSFSGTEVIIKDYPATSIEDEIVAAVKAEKDGALGLICGPVAATTVQRVSDIPVVSMSFTQDVLFEAVNSLKARMH
ncbi:helix-turn-helix domain-containing protein [archaeon]